MTRLFIGLIAAAVAGAAIAANMAVFRDAPITRLSQPELAEFKSFVEETLDKAPDGKTVNWKAPKTRFTSEITLNRSLTDAGRRCREITVNSDSHDRQMRGVYMFCKVANGTWEFRSPKGRPSTGK